MKNIYIYIYIYIYHKFLELVGGGYVINRAQNIPVNWFVGKINLESRRFVIVSPSVINPGCD